MRVWEGHFGQNDYGAMPAMAVGGDGARAAEASAPRDGCGAGVGGAAAAGGELSAAEDAGAPAERSFAATLLERRRAAAGVGERAEGGVAASKASKVPEKKSLHL